jgi:YggT family protein
VLAVVCFLGNLYFLTILVRIVMSWFPLQPDGLAASAYRLTVTLTEPVLGPIRRALPMVRLGGMGLDLSPIIVILGLRIVLGLIGC